MKIISLSGKKQSGKSTIASLIKDVLIHKGFNESQIHLLAFADCLKEELSEAMNVSLDFIETNKTKLRPLLQCWGTEFRRELVDKDYWVRKLFTKLIELPNNSFVVISDSRFLNEVKMLKEVDALLVRVKRNNDIVDDHRSETELDTFVGWDSIIENNGSIGELRGTVLSLLERHKLV